ncbi:MAG TPA: helix-turn-helix domain-containing protein [Pyrinomonadaceae bacterium]|nr:helix-turn-helix domain-containing protein [Pyrinomonadaceae bacterium]
MKDAHTNREEAREEFLTARQLAEVLQVSESTVRRLARDGRIPSVRLTPRILRFNLKSVVRALDGAEHSRRPRRQQEEKPREDSQLSFAEML